ncbi:tRNA glutamyl-Q(34) synthetase GluQRS [Brevundimonas sp. VNH65]|uniref:tRNA glutamyl-Q(34) synthetase GluQRS n=1 Tax=Brevundimonas sp. VNH65 TaxID=3400917 RepID=UPI003C118376
MSIESGSTGNAPAVRFAPSPTGDLHLGHAFSAGYAAQRGGDLGARFLIRIEDIDRGRSRPEFIDRNLEDLAWLGLVSEGEVWRQSGRMVVYRQALERLDGQGVLYPCFCTRADIRREIEAMGGAPQDHVGHVYSGKCRHLSAMERQDRIGRGDPYAIRLDGGRALDLSGPLTWTDVTHGTFAVDLSALGDFVVARKDTPTSYHLAVTVDDAAQGVVRVTRGEDLLSSTPAHRLLQALLGLDVPVWDHHLLVVDDDGRRLAKRLGSPSLRDMREAGLSPQSVLETAAARAIGRAAN